MFISGIGFISGAGTGLQALGQTIESPAAVPEIAEEIIKSCGLPRNMRRADRFSRLCMIAGNEAVKDSGITATGLANCGVIVATAFGPHETTFSFLDDLLNYSAAEVSPTKFSHSVHNAAASYTAILCGVDRLSLTVVGFDNPWAKALLTAEMFIEQGQAERILLIGADEKKLLAKLLQKDKTPGFSHDFIECAVGMLLTAKPETNTYCRVSALKENDFLIFTDKSGSMEKLPFSYSGNVFFGNALDCAAIATK